jgi:hypothetical protein
LDDGFETRKYEIPLGRVPVTTSEAAGNDGSGCAPREKVKRGSSMDRARNCLKRNLII